MCRRKGTGIWHLAPLPPRKCPAFLFQMMMIDHLTACWRAGLSCCGLCPKHLCPVLPALALHDVLDALKAGTALPRRPLPSAPASPASRIPSQELAGWRLSAALVSPQYSSAPSCMFLLHCVGIGICCVVLNYRKLTVATLDIIVTVLL